MKKNLLTIALALFASTSFAQDIKLPAPDVKQQSIVDALNARGIKHEYYYGGHGGHDWSTWRHLLYYRFLPNIFRDVR